MNISFDISRKTVEKCQVCNWKYEDYFVIFIFNDKSAFICKNCLVQTLQRLKSAELNRINHDE